MIVFEAAESSGMRVGNRRLGIMKDIPQLTFDARLICVVTGAVRLAARVINSACNMPSCWRKKTPEVSLRLKENSHEILPAAHA